MVQLIVGDKGKGKTKYLLDKVNAEVKEADGNIVYLDKSSKHMHELDNKVLKYFRWLLYGNHTLSGNLF